MVLINFHESSRVQHTPNRSPYPAPELLGDRHGLDACEFPYVLDV
jgi:hypothetical protein